jgi:2',3'-cyclic-nucleotide 2'-phosphodiesterase (5'-nucleotidase family)
MLYCRCHLSSDPNQFYLTGSQHAGTKMDEPLGWSHIDLDARFDTVRQAESNLGSLFADVMRISLGADVAFFNGGTIRSDQVSSGRDALKGVIGDAVRV